MRRAIAATLVLAVVALVAGYALAATPAPTTPQEWCRVVDVATGDEVTVPCHRDTTTTTTTTTTTVAPTTTTTVPPTTTTTTTLPTVGGFVETFDGNTGLDRFVLGEYHRDPGSPWAGDSWVGDHDENCSLPEQKRVIRSEDPIESRFYVCRDHLMTAMGDVSGYSVLWFSPKGADGAPMVFDRSDIRTVSWDVNTTDLGLRQWIEVKILPVDAPEESVGDDFTVSGLPPYPAGSVVHGAGGGDKVFLVTDEGRKQFYLTYNGFGELQYPDRATDLRTRYPMSMTDNGDGTITWTITDARGPQTFIGRGSFPEQFKVVFADHNYTPDKDLGPLRTYTWHWDNIVID